MDTLALITNEPLDEASPTPLYLQLKHRILQLIATDTLGTAETLPAEQALAQALGLSRATVRRCFKDLVDEGFVTHRRGRGSFVASREGSAELDTLYARVSTSSAIERSGATASSRLLGIKTVPAPRNVAASLGVDAGAELWEVNRLRLANDEPVIHELAYVSHALCPTLDRTQLETTSLYLCIAEETGLLAVTTEEHVEAVILDKREARLLQVSPGSAGLRLFARSLDTQGRALEASVGIARADRLRLDISYRIEGVSVRKAV